VAEQGSVLIVEDDADLREMLRTALRLAGFKVDEAADGLAALAHLDTHKPDAVVLDLGLPGFSGETVLGEIRAQMTTCDIPVVVVSGLAKPEDVALDCFLKKPARADAVLGAVRRCIEARRK
jgi:DNA-binding response OmpR family regulator